MKKLLICELSKSNLTIIVQNFSQNDLVSLLFESKTYFENHMVCHMHVFFFGDPIGDPTLFFW